MISSSPRKGGNGDLLCDQFDMVAQEAGHDAEKIVLRNQGMNYRTGCGTCFGGKPCPQKDDVAEVVGKMIASDVVVMATPVYFYTMCAQMKTLIDRTCSRYTEIWDKEFYFVLTAADYNRRALDRTLEGFRGFTSCLGGAAEKGVVYGTGAWCEAYAGDKTHGSRLALRTCTGYAELGEYGRPSPLRKGALLHPEAELVEPGFNVHRPNEVEPRRNGGFYSQCWQTVVDNTRPAIVVIQAFNDCLEESGVWITDTGSLDDTREKWTASDGTPMLSPYWDLTKDRTAKLPGRPIAK